MSPPPAFGSLPTEFPASPVALDRTRQAAPQVFEQLRERIVSLALPPGTVLARAELAQAFGVSQTPVRDALMRLGEEGLVDVFPQHATLVSRIDTASAAEVHFMRRSIEIEVAGTLAQEPGRAPLEALAGVLKRQSSLLAAGDHGGFIEADREFHRLLYAAAGVTRLFDLVRRMSGHADRLRRLHLPSRGKAQAVVRDHRRIVDAIASGDAPAAREAVRGHLSDTQAHMDALRAKYPQFVV